MSTGLSRRDFLGGGLSGLLAAAASPRLALARADTDRRFVVVMLRGALDGLAAVAPFGDPHYRDARGELALAPPGSADGVLDLDGFFGLHPRLVNLHRWFGAGQGAVVHAAATPYRQRSHFDAQNLLENGTTRPFGADDGWLNRAIAHMPGHAGTDGPERGLALGQAVPLMLRGAQPVGSWAPSKLPQVSDETLDRIMDLYAPDPFFVTRLARALETEAMAPPDAPGRVSAGRQFALLAEAAGGFLARADGPRIALLELSGWDTHANQGAATGQLAARLGLLDEGLGALEGRLGAAWSSTVVVAVSEFGRTVSVNGTRGTDHGTAGVMLLAGGAVAGGRVLADWPGLAPRDRRDGRDLEATTDVRSVFKALLAEHMAVPSAALETHVFPNSGDARPLEGLV